MPSKPGGSCLPIGDSQRCTAWSCCVSRVHCCVLTSFFAVPGARAPCSSPSRLPDTVQDLGGPVWQALPAHGSALMDTRAFRGQALISPLNSHEVS